MSFQDRYDPVFQARIDACPIITISDLSHLTTETKCAQLRYSNNKEYVAIADTLEIMNDLKVMEILFNQNWNILFQSNVPRTAYRGVVQCQYGLTTIFVTPNQQPWKGYG